MKRVLHGAQDPRVSVCIANHNGEQLLADCIDSVLSQATDTTIEIIVHDDASSDGSLALLRKRYPKVRIITADRNVGYCVSNNRMAEMARGEYLLLLNNDAALFPDAIATLLAAAMELPEISAILTLPQYSWGDGRLINRGCRLDITCFAVPEVVESSERLAMVEGACFWLPRKLWHELGGFPAWFGSIAEDAFLCCAARVAGSRVRCVDASGFRHRQGASFGGNRIDRGQLSTRYRRRYLSERNRLAVLVSCTPTWLAWAWLSLHLLGLVAEATALCFWMRELRPWRDIYSPALHDAWRNRRSFLALRHEVQTRRRIGLREYLRGFTLRPQKLQLLLRHGGPRLRD